MKKTALDSALKRLREARETDDECFVERYYIDQYAQEYVDATIIQNTHEENCEIVPDEEPRECTVIELMFLKENNIVDLESSLCLYYFDTDGQQTGLIIVDKNNNMAYWRNANQDPRTEWQICSLAQDITDDDSNFVFDGEPYNI